MRIKKVFNNNVALVENNVQKEMIVMGKAIGFQKYPGDAIDDTLIEKTFVLEAKGNTDKLIGLFNEIPSEDIDLADEVISLGHALLKRTLNENMIIALSDHISFALKRAKEGVVISNPLQWEIKQVYPAEVAVGKQALELIFQRTGVKLPESEAVFIALHFVNGQLDGDTGDDSIQLTNVISKVLDIVRYHYLVELDNDSLNYTRFVTHLRYFIRRQAQGETIPSDDEFLHDVVKEKYPKAYQCSVKIKRFLSQSYGWECTTEEMLYLTVHISRVTSRLAFEE
jgi:beta-glucoside operon transcriptional antiterminator